MSNFYWWMTFFLSQQLSGRHLSSCLFSLYFVFLRTFRIDRNFKRCYMSEFSVIYSWMRPFICTLFFHRIISFKKCIQRVYRPSSGTTHSYNQWEPRSLTRQPIKTELALSASNQRRPIIRLLAREKFQCESSSDRVYIYVARSQRWCLYPLNSLFVDLYVFPHLFLSHNGLYAQGSLATDIMLPRVPRHLTAPGRHSVGR